MQHRPELLTLPLSRITVSGERDVAHLGSLCQQPTTSSGPVFSKLASWGVFVFLGAMDFTRVVSLPGSNWSFKE